MERKPPLPPSASGSRIDWGSIAVPAVLIRFSHRRDADAPRGRNQKTPLPPRRGRAGVGDSNHQPTIRQQSQHQQLRLFCQPL